MLLTPYPPGIPLLIPGECFNTTICNYLKFVREFNAAFLALKPIPTVWSRIAKVAILWIACGKLRKKTPFHLAGAG